MRFKSFTGMLVVALLVAAAFGENAPIPKVVDAGTFTLTLNLPNSSDWRLSVVKEQSSLRYDFQDQSDSSSTGQLYVLRVKIPPGIQASDVDALAHELVIQDAIGFQKAIFNGKKTLKPVKSGNAEIDLGTVRRFAASRYLLGGGTEWAADVAIIIPRNVQSDSSVFLIVSHEVKSTRRIKYQCLSYVDEAIRGIAEQPPRPGRSGA